MPLAGSNTGRSLQKRADTARPLQHKLREVLKSYPPGSKQWEDAMDLMQWVCFKTGQIFRILDHDYPEGQTANGQERGTNELDVN